MEFNKRMDLLEELTKKIFLMGNVRNRQLAEEIARRWLKY